ncbi:MAG: hypothetical protein U5L04_06055 [Trueperaceae bacterium]|nr:hypothetical protein [Trueperaceae bacterium]
MSNDYGWERFWCLRGETIHLDSKGFLSDPNSKYSPNDLLSNLLSTRSLSEARGHDDKPLSCLILLGEPGIGKTRELKRLHEEEKKLADDSGNLVLKYNLGNCTDAQELREKVFRSPVFRQWQSNENRLFLHLDSLDEGLLSLRRLSQLILAELKDEGVKPHLSRLFLRITCRSAIWSSNFEHGLVDLWGDQVTPYELAPLRRVDVEQAASENKIDPLMFLKEIAVKEVSALAIRPMTLNFLISSFERGQELPSEKHRIYYKGCQQLCKELNPDRRSSQQTGSLNEDQRLVVAGRIAAVMTFANRGSIYLGSGNPDKDDLTCSEIRGGKETVNGNDFEINDNELKETLDTGLFNARGDDRLGWAHQTYQEFLAAWYLQKHRLEKSQILSLITHHGDEEGKLVPQLHETSAWLASKNDDVFSEILKTDPNVLLNSDIETFGDEQKKQLINALFVAYEEKKLFDNWYRSQKL